MPVADELTRAVIAWDEAAVRAILAQSLRAVGPREAAGFTAIYGATDKRRKSLMRFALE
jgi:hypothetical protein